MATVTEKRESGEGNVTGLGGDRGVRVFDVFLDQANTDSVTGLPDNRKNPLLPVAARYPQGTVHPDSSILTAQRFIQGRMLDMDATTSHWLVTIEYTGPVSAIGAIQGWTVEYDVALESEPMTRDLDGAFIGGHEYDLDPNGAFRGKTKGPDLRLKQLSLDDIYKPRPLRRFAPVTGIRLSNTIADLTTMAIKSAESFVGTCNASPFLTAEIGELLVGPMRIRQIEGTTAQGAEATSGFLWNVELNFTKKRGGWVFETVWDFLDYQGNRGAVLGIDPRTNQLEPVGARFRIYELSELKGMLLNFKHDPGNLDPLRVSQGRGIRSTP